MNKKHDKTIKAKIAIEALRGEKTLQEIATKYEVHPNQVSKWKQQLIDTASIVFEKNNGQGEKAHALAVEKDGLMLQIGELTVENSFLKKKYRQMYGTEP